MTNTASGAQTSLFGGFKSLVEGISPGVLGFLTAREQSRAASVTNPAPAPAPAATVAQPDPAAKPAWLLPALIGGGVLAVGALVMFLRRK